MSLHQVATTENSKNKRKLTVEDLIGESSLVIETKDAVDKMKKTADVVVNKGKEKTAPMRRRKRFISVKEFNQLAQDAPVEWDALKNDCIYKLVDLDRLVGRVVANLTDEKGRSHRAFVPSVALQTLHDKIESQSSKDTPIEIYLRLKNDKQQVDIAIKETFPCRQGCSEEFHSNASRWLHHKHCAKTDI